MPEAVPETEMRRTSVLWRFLRDRMTVTACLAVALIVGAGLLRPAGTNWGVYPQVFWLRKAAWRGVADMVVAGDSRVYRSVSPAAMQKVMRKKLGPVRVVNFGFNSSGYSKEYLSAIESVLEAGRANRTIVLGITPHSLTPSAMRDNGFLSARRELSTQSALMASLPSPLIAFFEPLSLRDLWRGIFPKPAKRRYYEFYHADGWVAGTRVPQMPRKALRAYENIFENNKVCERAIANITAAVRRWRKGGIRVYAFRVPSCAAMVKLEGEKSGFDEADFRRRFETAGGTWIEMDQDAYHTYDGSHIHSNGFAGQNPPGGTYPNDATKLSEDLAKKISAAGGPHAASGRR